MHELTSVQLHMRCVLIHLRFIFVGSAVRALIVAIVTLSFWISLDVRSQEYGAFTALAEIENQSAQAIDLGAQAALLSLVRSLTLETDDVKLEPILKQSKRLLKQSIFLGVNQSQVGNKQTVSFEFDAQAVTQAIFAQGLGVVPADRPRPLLWWVMNDKQGRIRYIDTSRDVALIESARATLDEYGLDFDLPLYDLTDTMAVPADALWQGDPVQIARGMLRYEAQSQRIVKWAELSDDRIFLSISLLSDGRFTTQVERIYTDRGQALGALIEALTLMVRSELAVIADDTELPSIVINEVTDFGDYRRILRALEANVFVESVQVVRLSGQTITLAVKSPASVDQFKEIMRDTLGLEYLGSSELGLQFRVGE